MLNRFLITYIAFFVAVAAFAWTEREGAGNSGRRLKLYWFIPDGLRAEPEVFRIFDWARSGELPNLARLMKKGSWGYSRPVFPSHTPVNFATLLTGSLPRVHGVSDGAMRSPGYPLNMVVRGGFSSVARKVPSLWSILEGNDLLVSLLSVPGSTPPEIVRGNTIRGRWGGWGMDFPPIVFHSDRDKALSGDIGQNKRVFTLGPDLTRFVGASTPKGWSLPLPPSFSPLREIRLTNWGLDLYVLTVDSTDDGTENYDRILISGDKSSKLAELGIGQWSDWLGARLSWETKNDYHVHSPKKTQLEEEFSRISVETRLKIVPIKLGARDFFRIRIIYDGLNSFSTQPPDLAEAMESKLGPMVDFVDSYPPQLIFFLEDKDTFLRESEFSFDWHRRAVPYLIKDLGSEAVIQSIYSSNQMLTSRWWMPYLDPKSPTYREVSEAERARLWAEVKSMYKKVDAILGEILDNADEDTIIAFSSDHGALPLYKEVRLNNFFASKGWLKWKFNASLQEYEVDWPETKVVFLQMNNIFINPEGLGGVFQRPEGRAYADFREEVIRALADVKDSDGTSPFSGIWRWEEVEEKLGLPHERVGDLVIANKEPYLWAEDRSAEGTIFVRTLKGGYKQAVDPENPGLLTPFVLAGPGVKAGFELPRTIQHADQMVTLLGLLNMEVPGYATGRPVEELLEK